MCEFEKASAAWTSDGADMEFRAMSRLEKEPGRRNKERRVVQCGIGRGIHFDHGLKLSSDTIIVGKLLFQKSDMTESQRVSDSVKERTVKNRSKTESRKGKPPDEKKKGNQSIVIRNSLQIR